MQNNRNDYNTRPSWVPAQDQPHSSRFVTSQDGEMQFALPQNLAQTQRPVNSKPQVPEKMPKARAIALANKFKRGLAISSIIGFGAFGGLVALHQVGTTAAQSTQSSSGSSSSNSSNSTNSSSSSSQGSNNFFNQQGGNTSGSSSSSNGSSSSNSSSSSSSSSTVSGTHTS